MLGLMTRHPNEKLYPLYYPVAKRMIDLLLCLILAIPAAVATIFIAIAIRLDSRGPIFFIQERVGKGARPFKIIKFHTLHHDIDQSAHCEFMKDYVRGELNLDEQDRKIFKPVTTRHVTRVGRILRKTSLDELPQLINVVKGDMSLVGPRPNVAWEVEAYKDWHRRRLEVLPGITGLAQVCGRSEIRFDEIVAYDLEYIENQSLKTDLSIMWRTLTVILGRKGAC